MKSLCRVCVMISTITAHSLLVYIIILIYSTSSHSICSVLYYTILLCDSWALRDVREVSSLYVTQISSTFFSLHHHSMPPHTGESERSTSASDTPNDVIMSGDNVESTFKLHMPLSILHGHSDSHSQKEKEKENDSEVCSASTISTRMATIRVQQSNLTKAKNSDNHHHNARDKKYQVDVEFENSHDYNLVHTKICENPNFFNDSDTLELQTENCSKGDFQKMKMQFSIGPEIDNLRIFVTSLYSAYPKN